MIQHIADWWKHLGYCWNKKKDNFKTFGIRPWRGAPFFWFCIDTSNTATLGQSDKHRAECQECQINSETKIEQEENIMPSVSIQSIIDSTRRAALKEAVQVCRNVWLDSSVPSNIEAFDLAQRLAENIETLNVVESIQEMKNNNCIVLQPLSRAAEECELGTLGCDVDHESGITSSEVELDSPNFIPKAAQDLAARNFVRLDKNQSGAPPDCICDYDAGFQDAIEQCADYVGSYDLAQTFLTFTPNGVPSPKGSAEK